DQVGNGLGLGKIKLVIEESALAELAWPRQASTQLDAALKQHVQHHGTTVALKLQDVFAGKGVRPWEKQQQAFVEHFTVVGMEGTVVGVPWHRLASTE